jgi:hypothetical protein
MGKRLVICPVFRRWSVAGEVTTGKENGDGVKEVKSGRGCLEDGEELWG